MFRFVVVEYMEFVLLGISFSSSFSTAFWPVFNVSLAVASSPSSAPPPLSATAIFSSSLMTASAVRFFRAGKTLLVSLIAWD